MQRVAAKQQHLASPFLKWAGGKSQLLNELESHIPEFQTYHEPFLGGGALFFHLSSSRPTFTAYLSDLNAELVNAYKVVKTDVDSLIGTLSRHALSYAENPERFYYRLRDLTPGTKLDRAARLVALNKTCYNGLYRVNSAGEFNVPLGRYKNPSICNSAQLFAASVALNHANAVVRTCHYQTALAKAQRGDFVYLDPPFVPLSQTSNFVNYTQGGFTTGDQRDLATLFGALHKRGCKVLLSNSDTKLARQLYSEFDQFRIKASRAISCKGETRSGYTELLVRNFTP
jgi:DNA adenine methylase